MTGLNTTIFLSDFALVVKIVYHSSSEEILKKYFISTLNTICLTTKITNLKKWKFPKVELTFRLSEMNPKLNGKKLLANENYWTIIPDKYLSPKQRSEISPFIVRKKMSDNSDKILTITFKIGFTEL